jgi:hypothetical protein
MLKVQMWSSKFRAKHYPIISTPDTASDILPNRIRTSTACTICVSDEKPRKPFERQFSRPCWADAWIMRNAAYWTDTVHQFQVKGAIVLIAVLWDLGFGGDGFEYKSCILYGGINTICIIWEKNLFITLSDWFVVPTSVTESCLLRWFYCFKQYDIWGLDRCAFHVSILSLRQPCCCSLNQYVSLHLGFDNKVFF